MLSRLVIAFLPRSKRLLLSWLQSPSAVILEPKKVKSVTVPIVSPSICHEVMDHTCVYAKTTFLKQGQFLFFFLLLFLMYSVATSMILKDRHNCWKVFHFHN